MENHNQPITIDLSAVVGLGNQINEGNVNDLCYVYQLERNGVAFYVGTSVNPCSRLLAHLALRTRDTAPIIGAMLDVSEMPTMTVLDVTTRAHRYHVEARWINEVPNTVNTTRYRSHYQQWTSCPKCYRSLSTGTLSDASLN